MERRPISLTIIRMRWSRTGLTTLLPVPSYSEGSADWRRHLFPSRKASRQAGQLDTDFRTDSYDAPWGPTPTRASHPAAPLIAVFWTTRGAREPNMARLSNSASQVEHWEVECNEDEPQDCADHDDHDGLHDGHNDIHAVVDLLVVVVGEVK